MFFILCLSLLHNVVVGFNGCILVLANVWKFSSLFYHYDDNKLFQNLNFEMMDPNYKAW